MKESIPALFISCPVLFLVMLLCLTLSLQRNADYQTRLSLARDTFSKNSRSAYAASIIANSIDGKKEKEKKLRFLNIAAENAPKALDRRHMRAHIAEFRGNLDHALSIYKTCHKEKRYSTEAIFAMIRIFLKLGRINEAEEIHSRYRDHPIISAFPGYYIAGVQIAIHKGLPPRDQQDFLEHAESCRPSDATTWYKIGFYWQRLGQKERAIRAFENALAYNPQHTNAKRSVGILYTLTEQHDRAVKCFRELIQRGEADFEIFWHCGRSYSRCNLFIMAAEMYIYANQCRPENYSAHFNLGAVYLNNFNWFKIAVYEFQKAARACTGSKKENVMRLIRKTRNLIQENQ